jgi:3-dehydroquinate synthase
MIDSSIGGKTGVDTPAGKNLVGVFHQPRLVVADLDVLSTLPLPHMAAGMAEAIKHGVIADADYLRLAERERTAVLARDPGVLERVVTRSVEIKAGVVAGDERESGRRAVLNFGHTVGHALEATSRYAVLHGEAVGIGMAVEGRVAERLGIAKAGVASRIERVLASYGLPRERPAESAVDDLIAVMRRDKKTRAGEIRLALPQAIGRMAGSADQGWTIAVAENVLREILSAPREGAL